MHANELKIFIKENAPWIYEYINKEVLKEVGVLNPNYFVKLIEDIFVKDNGIQIKKTHASLNSLPYLILSWVGKKGKMDYTSLRGETIDLTPLNNESQVYYNYAHFFLDEEIFYIDLMQTKIGGMPIDEDIVKYSQPISVKSTGLETFISLHQKKKTMTSDDTFKNIDESIKRML